MKLRILIVTCLVAAGLVVASGVSSAGAATFHYCGPCFMPWTSEVEGSTRHSYTQNYGHVVSAGSGWVGVRAHTAGHSPHGLNAQNWDVSIHSYSGANLLFMIVGNIWDDGVGNGYSVNDNAHGTY